MVQKGNSPVEVTNTNRGSTTQPDVEDINRDNSMNTVDSYYEYNIPISRDALTPATNDFVTDVRESTITLKTIVLWMLGGFSLKFLLQIMTGQ